jgi:hypothetical protein
MSTEAPVEHGFEERFATIEKLLTEFHGKFLQDNTNNTHNMRNVQTIPSKLLPICDTLRDFLAWCLTADRERCTEDELSGIVEINMKNSNAKDHGELLTLLKNMCEHMFPWNANMNSKVGHLIHLIHTNPFSPKA